MVFRTDFRQFPANGPAWTRGRDPGRGSAETGFIRSVDEAVDRFHAQVVTHLERRGAHRGQADERTAAR